MADKQRKIVFITGCDRSGTTLLDLLLGQIDDCFSLGETRNIWRRGFQSNQLCSCNSKFSECEFWQKVKNQAFRDINTKEVEDIVRTSKYINKRRNIPNLTFDIYSKKYKNSLDYYIEKICRLYKSIFNISGSKVLIDSSKRSVYGLLLNKIPNVELYIIHIVRDSRAVSYSMKRKKLRKEIYWKKQYMQTKGVARSSRAWMTSNIASHILKYKINNYLLIKYEELSDNPGKTIKKIMKFINEGEKDIKINKSKKKTHIISGNPIRFEYKEIVIKKDNEWIDKMKLHEKCLTTLLTLPLLVYYRYL